MDSTTRLLLIIGMLVVMLACSDIANAEDAQVTIYASMVMGPERPGGMQSFDFIAPITGDGWKIWRNENLTLSDVDKTAGMLNATEHEDKYTSGCTGAEGRITLQRSIVFDTDPHATAHMTILKGMYSAWESDGTTIEPTSGMVSYHFYQISEDQASITRSSIAQYGEVIFHVIAHWDNTDGCQPDTKHVAAAMFLAGQSSPSGYVDGTPGGGHTHD